MQALAVLHPGPLTTIQDLGRYGYQQYGVPPSGAIDDYAFRIGNLLVGNQETAASLEITLCGCRLRVLLDAMIAVTGADLGAAIGGNPIPAWESVSVRCGDIISFPRTISGCRTYLAIGGGIDVPSVMFSKATHTRARLGGLEGRAIRRGDTLRIGDAPPVTAGARVPPEFIPEYCSRIELRVILGPQDTRFTRDGLRTFLQSDYAISTEADRMGYRLEGPRIQHQSGADIVSDGIPLGAVQVPGDGLPIVLLQDRPTTGGYTKIATVISVDVPKLAQAKPGDQVRFQQVNQTEAHRALQEYEQQIRAIRSYLGEAKPHARPP